MASLQDRVEGRDRVKSARDVTGVMDRGRSERGQSGTASKTATYTARGIPQKYR